MVSDVWNHFIKKDKNKAVCKYCTKSYIVTGGTTTTLKRHYDDKHKSAAPGSSTSSEQTKQSSIKTFSTPKR
jgi:hypothetical protein